VTSEQRGGGEALAVIHVDIPGHDREIAAALDASLPVGDSVYLLVPEEHDDEQRSAQAGLTAVRDALRACGRNVDGEIADTFVLDAIGDVIRRRNPRAIVVLPPPLGLPGPLHLDLTHRIIRAFNLPTSHVVIPDATWSGRIDLSFPGLDVEHEAPAQQPGPPAQLPAWTVRVLIGAVAALAVALPVVFVVGLHQTSVDNHRLLVRATASPAVYTVLAGANDSAGAAHDYTAFYPTVLKVHAGDTITFHNSTTEVPHTVTFGVAADRSNEPLFGVGHPQLTLVAPCAAAVPLTQSTATCPGPRGPLTPFAGQAFYSSGIIAGGTNFQLRTAPTLRPGVYHYYCLIHPNQVGTIIVQPPGTATQLQSTVDAAASAQRRRDIAALTDLQPPTVGPDTVQAGVTGPDISLNQFFPSTVHVKVGETVTWVNHGGMPHVLLFGEYLDPATALFSPPTAPSGSDFSGQPFFSGPLGAPSYPRSSFTLRFTKPGTYQYVCSIHAGMAGTVIVDP